MNINDGEAEISNCSTKSSVRLNYPGMRPPGRTCEHTQPPGTRKYRKPLVYGKWCRGAASSTCTHPSLAAKGSKPGYGETGGGYTRGPI